MKLLLLHLSFRGSLPTRQAVRETARSCLLFSPCSDQTQRVGPLYRSMLGVSGRLAPAKKLMFWNASSKRKVSSASGRGWQALSPSDRARVPHLLAHIIRES